MTYAEIAALRRVAENPLVRPSERVAARRKLAEMSLTLRRSRREVQTVLGPTVCPRILMARNTHRETIAERVRSSSRHRSFVMGFPISA